MPLNGKVKLNVIARTGFIMFFIAVKMHAKNFLSLILILRRVILNYILYKKCYVIPDRKRFVSIKNPSGKFYVFL